MFQTSLGKGQATDVMKHYAIIKILDTQLQQKSELEDKGQFFLFREITYHWINKGTNSSYDVLIIWEDWSVTWEPVSVMRHYYPIYFAKYAHDHDLLDNPGWKQLRRYVNNTKKINRLLKATKAKQIWNTVKIKFNKNIPQCLMPIMVTLTWRTLNSSN